MRIRVTMPGAYTAVEFDDGRCLKAFQKLNEMLMAMVKEEQQKKQECVTVKDKAEAVVEADAAEMSEKAVEPESVLEVSEQTVLEKDESAGVVCGKTDADLQIR